MAFIEKPLLQLLIENCPADQYYWFSQDKDKDGKKKYFAIQQDKIQEYATMFDVNKHISEILPPDTPIHPYFDLEIEGTTNHQELLQLFLDWIHIIFKTEFGIDIHPIILDSCRKNKLSYHLIIDNCLFPSVYDLKKFIHWLYDQCSQPEFQWLYKTEARKIFDKLPYGKNQCFRMINQSKCGKPYILKGDYKPLNTFVRSKEGILLSANKYKEKKEKNEKNEKNEKKDEDLTETQRIYQEEFLEYYKFNLFHPIAMNGTWEDWRNAGFAIHSTFGDAGLQLFILFSKINPSKYNEKTTIDLYNSIKGTNKKITFHTLRMWAKKADKKLFVRIFSLYIEKLEERHYCETDDDASDVILELLQDRLLYANQHYFKKENVWINDFETIRACLFEFIMKAPIFKPILTGVIPYWKNYSNADKIVKTVLMKSSLHAVPYSQFHTSTKNKLCFQNGILDFKTKKFLPWNDECSVIEIPYNYKPSNPLIRQEIINKILEPLFGEKLDLALKYLARSMAGCVEDKNFATYIGNRNCGKGVFYSLMKSAFGDYVSSFSLSNLLCTRKGKDETSKDLYWLMDLEFVRLAISQEIPIGCEDMKLKTDLVKKVCSGGDTQIARRNYDRHDTHFQLDCSLFSMANGLLKMEGDILEHHLGFESAIQFKSQEFIDNIIETQGELCAKKYRVADPSIKDKVNDYEWNIAMVDILLDAFQDKPLTVHNECEEEKTMISVFLEHYEITKNDNDVVLLSELKELGEKIKSELQQIGIEIKKHIKRDDYRFKMCAYGIKKRILV